MNWKLLPTALIVELTGVDASTARRYKRQRRAPVPVVRLLSLYLDGKILPDAWQWSHFEGDCLVVDDGQRYTLGQFRAEFWRAQARELELQELRKRVNMTLRPHAVPDNPRQKQPVTAKRKII